MKKLIAISALIVMVLGMSTKTSAQNIVPKDDYSDEVINKGLLHIQKELNLNENQVEQIRPFISEGIKEMRHFMPSSQVDLTREERDEHRRRINNQLLEGLKIHLTPEQIEKYKTIRVPLLQGGK
ncbi:hypothetical protein [Aquirufa nivalisilvae]